MANTSYPTLMREIGSRQRRSLQLLYTLGRCGPHPTANASKQSSREYARSLGIVL
jgi:hypothetical protein